MSAFEIIVIVLLYLIWAQHSAAIKRAATWLTARRRITLRLMRERMDKHG